LESNFLIRLRMKRSGTSPVSAEDSKASEPKIPALENGDETESGPPSPAENNADNEADDEHVTMNIEGITPEDSDKESIFNLINSLLRFMNVNVLLIVDEIIKQNHLGSILNSPTIEGENEIDGMGVLGVCTAITPIHNDASHPVNRIIEFALESSREDSEDSDEAMDFYETLKSWRAKLGLLIYDRFINLSPSASIAQIESLRDELRDEPHIEYLLVVERVYKVDESGPLKYQLFEQEFMEEYASCVHEVALDVSDYGNVFEEDSQGTTTEGLPYRRLLLIRVDMIQQFILKCQQELPNMVKATSAGQF